LPVRTNKSITIREYAAEQVEAVRQFNERLAAGGAAMRFPLSPVPEWLPKLAGRRLYQELYLAVDESAAVHGAYLLKHQDFWIGERVAAIADFHLPISEGVVNKSYPQVGVQLLRDALQRQPLLYGLGIGGYAESLTRLLMAAGWAASSVPFFFRVVHPSRFLRNVSYLRRRPATRWTLDALARSGVGWLGIHATQAVLGRRRRPDPAVRAEQVDEFADWADELWRNCRNHYGMSAVRDAETLRILYPKDDRRFIRLKLTDGSRVVGWAVLLDSRLSGHNYFDNMRLGSIVDNFAAPVDAAAVAGAAAQFLQSQGVDLIVSNQAHAAWQHGLRRAGFLRGPSNFIFASSPKLTALLRQAGAQHHDLHLNRGDGDGPINL
jgi:hypothetical protein